MAIVILGKTPCKVCGEPIMEGDVVVMFSHFVANPRDPIYPFTDSTSHREHFEAHPLAEEVRRRWDEVVRAIGPGNRICVVCGATIDHPDDYFTLHHLTVDPQSSLYAFNYAQFHRAHLRQWPRLDRVLDMLEQSIDSGEWDRQDLAGVMRVLRSDQAR